MESAQQAPEKTVYTPEEVAQLLSIEIKAVYRALKKKEIHSVRIGRRWLIPIKSFNDLLEKGGI